ncbi:MAG: DUF2281 domain-containing protein [Spirosomaceae bacterium]|jgi:hypothetical protein|nr:DUF2281 domain-containing protein [Spirosomataceae bacterium]
MYASVNGVFEDGRLILLESPPTTKKSKVVVTFLEELDTLPKSTTRKRPFGIAKGTIQLSDDFNEPLDDLKEYM